jgi:hypothetical protein
VRWWDKETGTLQPSPTQSFVDRYGVSSQSEHPRELAAVELAKNFKNPSDIDRYLKG